MFVAMPAVLRHTRIRDGCATLPDANPSTGVQRRSSPLDPYRVPNMEVPHSWHVRQGFKGRAHKRSPSEHSLG